MQGFNHLFVVTGGENTRDCWSDMQQATVPKLKPTRSSAQMASTPHMRASLFGPEAPRFTGKVCWRLPVPVDAVKDDVGSDYTLWLGLHGSVMVYRVRRGELINVVAHCDNDTWTEES